MDMVCLCVHGGDSYVIGMPLWDSYVIGMPLRDAMRDAMDMVCLWHP